MKGTVKDDADYEDFEEELEEGVRLFPAIHEKASPVIADMIEGQTLDVGFRLSYKAEGGANVIFKIEINGAEYLPLLPAPTRQKMQALQGMLLRIRKQVGAHARSTCEMMEEYETRIKPLFEPKYLLRQKLIRLPRDTTFLLRQILVAAEEKGLRPVHRRGDALVPQSYIATAGLSTEDPENPEDHGILVQDLSPQIHKERLLEFKPKWLISSKSAPATSKRCRTCALREMRRADKTPSGRGDSQFCPLDLLSNKSHVLRPALDKLWNSNKTEREIPNVMFFEEQDEATGVAGDLFEKEFRRKVQRLLGHLKGLQQIYCHADLREFDCGSDEDLSIAMALRDCSVLLKIEAIQEKVEILDVKLIDLDLKLATSSKRKKWMEMERRLVEEGWYEGKMPPGIVEDEITCRESRSCT